MPVKKGWFFITLPLLWSSFWLLGVWVSQVMLIALWKSLPSCTLQSNWQDTLLPSSILCIPSLPHSQDLLIWRTGENNSIALQIAAIGAARKLCWFPSWDWPSPYKRGMIFLSVSMWVVNSSRGVDAPFPEIPTLQPQFGIWDNSCTQQQNYLLGGLGYFAGEAFLLLVGAVILTQPVLMSYNYMSSAACNTACIRMSLV